jgi:uncharacterized protein (DUF1800 family)
LSYQKRKIIMKNNKYSFWLLIAVFALALLFSSFVNSLNKRNQLHFPYQKAGLTSAQAAAHLLSRFTYGASPSDLDLVQKIGLENWFEQQLAGNLADEDLNVKLSRFDAINLSNTEAENIFPRNAQLINFAIKEGYLNKDSVNKSDNKAYRDKIQALMKAKGYRPQQELFRQLISQKILRATYTKNQMRELMTDFWFNHFNVSLNKNQCAIYIPAFERDVIRPNVFGKFEDLLLATAKSPAMLMYLDNSASSGNNTSIQEKIENVKNNAKKFRGANINQANKRKAAGINENYARELMELHTLGVDGGYTQSDVTQAAKILTGWTIAPMGKNGYGGAIQKVLDKVGEQNLIKNGFVREGDFLFANNRHDDAEKYVLGKKFAAGGGYQEGVDLLKMLANHQATSKFIAKKIATRFVSDNPPQSLIDQMAKTFLVTKGDLNEVMKTMVSAPEFWSKTALREKTKSPFEFAISAVRSMGAQVNQPYQLYTWINKMGQQMYSYQAPTGFPDSGQYWINTGSLLNRMNFGLALASQRIPGIAFNLIAINDHHEPESAEAALEAYSKIFMPQRNLNETIARLKPMLSNPNLEENIAKAAEKNTLPQQMNTQMIETDLMGESDRMVTNKKGKKAIENSFVRQKNGSTTMLSQVVGLIIGSPEFQRK